MDYLIIPGVILVALLALICWPHKKKRKCKDGVCEL